MEHAHESRIGARQRFFPCATPGRSVRIRIRVLSPLIYTYINPYGGFEVDLARRIDFERKAA